jgi:hypothetical protein
MRSGKLMAALSVLTLGTFGLLPEDVHASQRTTFGEALRDGYEVRALAFVPTEASSRQTGEQTPDALILTLQKENSVVVCYYTLAAYVSDDVMDIDSCKAHASSVTEADTETQVPDAATSEAPPTATITPDEEAPAGEATAEEPGDEPAAGGGGEPTEPDGPETDTESEFEDDESPLEDAEAE